MQVSYQHANPYNGRESHLLRFHDEIHDQTTCILVDAGSGVDVDDLLEEDEYLSAILLTHAHLDHYRTLGSNLRDGAPIYATSETAAAITTRLDTDAEHADLANPGDVAAAIEPITDWTTITSDVQIHPVPAGHAPGGCGFVVRFADGDDHHHLLATGDFTTRRAAGYPGLGTDLPVDAVLLTAATNTDFRDQLTGAVGTVLKRASAGSTVLTTSSGSTGVHLAYLLAHVAGATDLTHPVTVAGRVATLWEALEYDHPGVECVPTFEDPDAVLGPGRITIAGPEVPIAGSSERLFDAIEDDAGATLVQVTSGAFDPKRSAGCMVHDYQLSNHPTEETVDSVVEALEPIHVVVTHQRGYVADQYKDKYDSFVWATDDATQYTLYDDGWSGPPWVTEATRRRVRSRRYTDAGSDIGGSFDTADIPLPTVERHDDVDLVAEGIDTARLAEDLGLDPAVLEESPVAISEERTDESVAFADGASVSDPAEEMSRSDSPENEQCPDGSTAEADDESGTDSFAEVLDRLDRIEDAVTGTRTTGTVVDAGDGVTLLRLTNESVAEDLTHGQLVELDIQTAPERDASDETGSD
ncbi:cleavage protein [Halorhabdus tiamatea SARL4B]|uniref:Cleavage protein n=1 Tax=Halorhabdus tiamatea SARL4B TaxID=1033806 RepID=F7PNA2_9EURY|nr:MBL fold metallo-hydrolase [Halorhabdus tiamatea]ERJ07805.1 cleavage protein [Halorhabdus tiamatea SARL4B]CCQ33395.1 metallo-beta-lactamase superfamily domain protein [Halorhabdus tiamatea SARL4B]